MIRFALKCSRDHEFDGWFASSKAFDEQVAAGLAECPVCGCTKIEKGLMAPSVRTSKRASVSKPMDDAPPPAEPTSDHPSDAAANLPAEISDMHKAMRSLASKLAKEVRKTAEDVGDRFADEARKIHYEEEDARPIYGRATAEEAAELHDEGIDFLPLPDAPESKN